MKQLTLIRHAKSSWDDPGADDIDRVLNKRGMRDAPRMGTWLAEQGIKPDQVWCSNAQRTRDTLSKLRQAWELSDDLILIRGDMYLCNANEIISKLSELPEDINDLVIIGHNPSLADLYNQLASEPCKKFVTCAIGRLALPIKRWVELPRLHHHAADVIFFQYPKNLAS